MNDTVQDLGLATSITTQFKKHIGAGANANTKADMMQYMGSDALAELVWSPQTGLNIKFAEEKPCFMLKLGTNDMTPDQECVASLATPLKIEPVAQCGPQKQVEMGNDLKPVKDGCFDNKIAENHNDESHGSMESCRSANFLNSRKRKCGFEPQSILGSKRIKNHGDSSFMNWISNTLKGLKNHTVYDPGVGVCNKTRASETKSFGFHNVFHSLFSSETIKQIENESKTVLARKCSHESPECVNQVSFYEKVTKEAPKEIFDTIRKLRLSRTNIFKWMNSGCSVANLDGFFLRLRVAKWEEGVGGSRYSVACIKGSEGKDSKQSVRVKVGDVECFVQTQHISNCDFLQEELIAWWQEESKNGEIPVVKDLKSMLAERGRLGM